MATLKNEENAMKLTVQRLLALNQSEIIKLFLNNSTDDISRLDARNEHLKFINLELNSDSITMHLQIIESLLDKSNAELLLLTTRINQLQDIKLSLDIKLKYKQ